jgi:hypothetical protein
VGSLDNLLLQVKCIGSLPIDAKREVVKMTFIKEKDYTHANERGNGPKARMEGGDQTDDISINDPDSLLRPELTKKQEKKDPLAMPKYTKPLPQQK